MYIALGVSKGYSLSSKFLHKSFFPKHRDFEFQVKSQVYRFYNQWIYKPVNDHRKREINLLNKKNKHYRQIIINNKLRSSTNIPGVVGYRNYFMDKMNPIG